MDKSWTTIEQRCCLACDKVYDTGNLLMKKGPKPDTISLEKTFDMHTLVGLGLCPEHDKSAEGYVILIEIDESKSTFNNEMIDPKNAHRTGRYLHIKEDKFQLFLNVTPVPIQYISIDAFDKIEEFFKNATGVKDES